MKEKGNVLLGFENPTVETEFLTSYVSNGFFYSIEVGKMTIVDKTDLKYLIEELQYIQKNFKGDND